MSNAVDSLIAVGVAIVTLAVIAVIVSKNSNTAGVLTAAGTALSTGITAAVSPVAAGTGLGSIQPPTESTYV